MLFTPSQLQKIREIVAKWHMAIAISVWGPDALPESAREELRRAGVDVPKGPLLLKDAYAYGQLLAALRQPALAKESVEQIQKRMEKDPIAQTPVERAAQQYAANHAAQYMVGLGGRVAGDVMTAVTSAESQLGSDRLHELVQDETERAIERRDTADKLRSTLGNRVGDWERDWGRLAMTETNNAIQSGVIDTIEKQHGGEARVSRVPRSNACPHCKRLFLDEDGNPKVFTVRELRANGSNVGRHVTAWKPTIEAVHPWCGCSTVYLPAGLSWINGELQAERTQKSEALDTAPLSEDPMFKFPRLEFDLTLGKAEAPAAPMAPVSHGPFMGPKGGKWADPAHKHHWALPIPSEPSPKVDTQKLLRGNLGIPRAEMPQIKAARVPEFISEMAGKGVHVTSESVPVHTLRATQNELKAHKVQKEVDAQDLDHLAKPLIVSKDNYLMDGHHRWAALSTLDPGAHANVVRVHLPIRQLLEHAHAFGGVSYKKSADWWEAGIEEGYSPAELLVKSNWLHMQDGQLGHRPVRPMSTLGNEDSPERSKLRAADSAGILDELSISPPAKKRRKKEKDRKDKADAERIKRRGPFKDIAAPTQPDGIQNRARDRIPDAYKESVASAQDGHEENAEQLRAFARRRKEAGEGLGDTMRVARARGE